MLVKFYLNSFAYRLLVTSDGLEGIALAAAHPETTLIIMDVVMPGICARRWPIGCRHPCPMPQSCFSSGHPATDMSCEGIDLKPAYFMEKPIQPWL